MTCAEEGGGRHSSLVWTETHVTIVDVLHYKGCQQVVEPPSCCCQSVGGRLHDCCRAAESLKLPEGNYRGRRVVTHAHRLAHKHPWEPVKSWISFIMERVIFHDSHTLAVRPNWVSAESVTVSKWRDCSLREIVIQNKKRHVAVCHPTN